MGILSEPSEFDRQFGTDVVQSAAEPIVTPKRVVIPLPVPEPFIDIAKHDERFGDFGKPEDMIAYLRQVNGVPDNAAVLTEYQPIRCVTYITFEWWEIEIKTKRRERAGGIH